jgi:HSP20 family protein
MTIERRTPRLGEYTPLREAIDRLFDESFIGRRGILPAFLSEGDRPALDIRSTADELVVVAALPGVDPEAVETTISGDTLTISGTYGQEQATEEEGYVYREIHRGPFHRSITLPRGLKTTDAAATVHNGLLTLRIPRTEEQKPKTIAIQAT